MHFVFRLLLLCSLLFTEVACVNKANLNEGIACFHGQNYRQAFIHLKPEAEKGQPDAQYAIGYMYYYGEGVIEDRKKAWFWINRAAAAGQPDAREAVKILRQQPKTITLDPLDPLIYRPD
ncbi:tetratricopeptide repeat protein [Legionella fairfieldensis]|uniref:tetratricopeptide repeat protein n=1 Tax=Legionella fairfieldensis TaxID=45064 RepID=UPI00068454DB|nr:tetratricopeptide repeat protein [Legionella fairfieldensis]